ncbi:glycosyltransferase family 4 protein [Prosthecobacter sp.]|uniref:glycosyltransferase family 4 protein n=1 Tax=Prosthecobacter sp. TaxID=1965333 RepID=UPI002ABA8562|nr:glycosyltransferase family 4 protein [Prosthecobacter sp.]MDZ4401085.1 glycosyltransferase family 4 protein [Prosthecobacter sp.]
MVNRLLGRRSDDLSRELIHSFPLLGLEYFARQALAKNIESRSAAYLAGGKKFARQVAKAGFGAAGGVFGFNTAALELLQAARKRGLRTVMEQCIAPRAYEEELLALEQDRFPGWEPPRVRGPSTQETIEREHEEWALADLILCGSEFVKHGVAHCGGPVERCVVVPYGVDTRFSPVPRSGRSGPLRVLSVGEAGLRKGVTYAMETAQMLGADAEFRWVGSVSLEPSARSQVAKFVQLAGAIPRSEMRAQFEWADVFFLPSVCEGSATVTYEALMSGLPVVTTPNTGSLVRDGVDGFVVPVCDTAAMTVRLGMLHHDRDLVRKMGEAAAAATDLVSLDAYSQRLLAALHGANSSSHGG